MRSAWLAGVLGCGVVMGIVGCGERFACDSAPVQESIRQMLSIEAKASESSEAMRLFGFQTLHTSEELLQCQVSVQLPQLPSVESLRYEVSRDLQVTLILDSAPLLDSAP